MQNKITPTKVNCFYTRKFDWTMHYNLIYSKNNNFTLSTIYWIILWLLKALIITNDILLYSPASQKNRYTSTLEKLILYGMPVNMSLCLLEYKWFWTRGDKTENLAEKNPAKFGNLTVKNQIREIFKCQNVVYTKRIKGLKLSDIVI